VTALPPTPRGAGALGDTDTRSPAEVDSRARAYLTPGYVQRRERGGDAGHLRKGRAYTSVREAGRRPDTMAASVRGFVKEARRPDRLDQPLTMVRSRRPSHPDSQRARGGRPVAGLRAVLTKGMTGYLSTAGVRPDLPYRL